MPRPYSRDVPMSRMPTPEDGAERSYISRRSRASKHAAVFVISCFSKRGHTEEGSWRLTHQQSGGHASLWSYRECIELIRKLTSMPRHERERWVILSRGDYAGQVLFDRASGEWWRRGNLQPVTQVQIELMSALQPISAFQGAADDDADANVDDDERTAGRPQLTMAERVERWQAMHVPEGLRTTQHHGPVPARKLRHA